MQCACTKISFDLWKLTFSYFK